MCPRFYFIFLLQYEISQHRKENGAFKHLHSIVFIIYTRILDVHVIWNMCTHTHTRSTVNRVLTDITSCVPVPDLHKNYSGNNKVKSILWNIEGCKLLGVIVFSVQTVQKADKVNCSMCVWKREDCSREMNTQMVLWCLTGTCYFVLFHLPPTHLHTENHFLYILSNWWFQGEWQHNILLNFVFFAMLSKPPYA